MTEKQQNPESVTAEAPVIEINGEKKQLPRLGLRTTLRVFNLIIELIGKAPQAIGQKAIEKMMDGEITQAEGLNYIVRILPYAEDQVIKLIAHIMDEDIETVENPEKYPMDSGIKIITALYKDHPDFKVFVGQLGKLMKENPEMKQKLQKAKKETDSNG